MSVVKADTHPDYPVVTISCACGSSFESRSTKGDYSVEVCSECHPFYTGTQKLIDVGGRVERFNKRRAMQASSLSGRTVGDEPSGRRTGRGGGRDDAHSNGMGCCCPAS